VRAALQAAGAASWQQRDDDSAEEMLGHAGPDVPTQTELNLKQNRTTSWSS